MNRNINDKYKDYTDNELKTQCFNESYYYDVMALNIRGELNMGAMMRSAHLCGCRKFVIFGRRKYDKRSCVGVYNYLTVDRICGNELTDRLTDEDYFLDEKILYNYIIDNNYIPIFIEQDLESINPSESNIQLIINKSKEINKIPLLIFGNEATGIPKNILDLKNIISDYYILELKQKGVIQSYNVSNTLSIICYKFMEYYDN